MVATIFLAAQLDKPAMPRIAVITSIRQATGLRINRRIIKDWIPYPGPMDCRSNRTILNKASLPRSSRNRKTVNLDHCLVAITGVKMRRIMIFAKNGNDNAIGLTNFRHQRTETFP
jgi:hypothetical protein